MGASGLILSWVFTVGVGAVELLAQGAELFNRFCSFGKMKVITTGGSSVSSASTGASSSSCDISRRNDNSNGAVDTDILTVIGLENAPVMYSDNCCTKWLRPIWPVEYLTSLVDSYHLIKRYKAAASKANKIHYFSFCKEISKCFGQHELGVLFPPEEIIANIENVKAIFEKPQFNVWNNETTKTHETEKLHIRNSTILPKVYD